MSGHKEGVSKQKLVIEAQISFILLLVFLPLLIWATGRITEIRKKAVDTSICVPVNKIITVTPPGGAGSCHDLQKAIDAVPNELPSAGETVNSGFVIRLAPGVYTIAETDDAFSINIDTKNRLFIVSEAEADPQQTTISFAGNRGGIRITDSQVSLNGLMIDGSTSNGILRIEDSPSVHLTNVHVHDQAAHTIQAVNLDAFRISLSDVQSGAVGIYLDSVDNFLIESSAIHNSDIGIAANDSGGQIKFNLFTDNRENAVRLTNSRAVTVQNNTITSNEDGDSVNPGTVDIAHPRGQATNIFFQRNVVAFNAGIGIAVHDDTVPASMSGTYTFDRNDIVGNTLGNTQGVTNPIGINGNISADPQFGEEYCLQPGSPALLGSVDYMGHRGVCIVATSTPTPTPTVTPTVTPTSTLTPTVTNTPTITSTPTPTSGGQRLSSFSFFVSIAGITKNRGTIPMQLAIGRMGSSTALYTGTVSTNYQRNDIYQGTVTGTSSNPLPEDVADNVYWVTVKGPHHLRRAFANIALTDAALVNLSNRRLEAGDVPTQDGYVNYKDINTMLGIIAKPIQSRSDLDTADVNRDGRVNAVDFGLLLKGFTQASDEVAP